jgi:hypothetical protein
MDQMKAYKWFSADDILALDASKLDRHMHKFIRKVQGFALR